MSPEKSELIYNAIINVATSGINLFPGGLGNSQPPCVDLKKLATELCDAFEIIESRESSIQQNQQ